MSLLTRQTVAWGENIGDLVPNVNRLEPRVRNGYKKLLLHIFCYSNMRGWNSDLRHKLDPRHRLSLLTLHSGAEMEPTRPEHPAPHMPQTWCLALRWLHLEEEPMTGWPPLRCLCDKTATQTAPVLEASCQTTSKTGTQPHPSADRLPKFLLSSQTPPKHTTWSYPAHQRDKTQFHPPEHRHQSLPPGSLRKPLDQPHPPGGRHQKQKELWPCGLQKGDHKHCKLDKMRRHKNMLQTKEQDKKTHKTK